MTNLEDHYVAADIEERIIKALHDVGLNPEDRLTPVQLAALDHFHTGGYPSSLELLEQSKLLPEHRVLDIGAGLAGAARMIVAEVGCDVDCIELSSDYCVGAKLLNRLAGMEEQVSVIEGSALDMPYENESFDAAWMQNVGMNIADKRGFYSEVSRVLKNGGRFAFQEMLAGDCDCSYYPLPWATVEEDNCLISVDELNTVMNDLGFDHEYFEDASESQLQPSPSNTQSSVSTAPQLSLSAYVDDLATKGNNAQLTLAKGQIIFVRAVYRKR